MGKRRVKKRKSNLPPGPGPGRPKGCPNKITKLVKDMIAEALENSGGVKYLEARARKNPVAFMALISRIIPLQVEHTGKEGDPIIIKIIAPVSAHLSAPKPSDA